MCVCVCVCVCVRQFSRSLHSHCRLIFPSRLYGFRWLACGPGSIDYKQPTNHADRQLGWEHTLAFNSAVRGADDRVESREQIVKHRNQENTDTQQADAVTLCIRVMGRTHTRRHGRPQAAATHTHDSKQCFFKIFLFKPRLSFASPALWVSRPLWWAE